MKNKLKILLIELNSKMVSKKYVQWMNSRKIVQFTEQRFKKHSINDVRNFVILKKKSKSEFLYGIFTKLNKYKIHIGNIKLGPIDFNHKTAEISYFIGDENFQKKGAGTLAIKEVLKLSKKKFKLKKIVAGVYANNIASKKVLSKNKFKLEGILKKQFIFRKKRINHLIYGKFLNT